MSVIRTRLDVRSADFLANAAAMRAQVEDLRSAVEKLASGGGDDARAGNDLALAIGLKRGNFQVEEAVLAGVEQDHREPAGGQAADTAGGQVGRQAVV